MRRHGAAGAPSPARSPRYATANTAARRGRVRVIEQQDSPDGRRLPANMKKRVLSNSVTKFAIVEFIRYLCFIKYLFL